MPDPTQIGTGTSVDFDSGFMSKILDVIPPNLQRGHVQTSHMGTSGNHTYEPHKLVEGGEFRTRLAFEPGANPPIDQDPESVTITFPDGETWVFTGFMTGYAPTSPLEDKMTCNCVIKVSGDVVVTAASGS